SVSPKAWSSRHRATAPASIFSPPTPERSRECASSDIAGASSRRTGAPRRPSAEMTTPPLTLVIAAIAAWLVIGALGLARLGDLKFVSRVLFPAGAAVGLAVAI